MNRNSIQTRALALRSAVSGLRARTAAVALAPTMALMSLAARAQATDPFDDAIAQVTTKVNAYGPKLVGLAAVAVLFFVAIKYVKKIPKAS